MNGVYTSGLFTIPVIKSIDCKPLFLGVYGLGFHNPRVFNQSNFIGVTMSIEKRSIRSIALDIRKEWAKVNYAAKPYLDAMLELNSINDKYGFDNARSIILYFLSKVQMCSANSLFFVPHAWDSRAYHN